MFVPYNPNPYKSKVGDCVIRALCKATDLSWDEVYTQLCVYGYMFKDWGCSNYVWGEWLKRRHFVREFIDVDGRYTVKDFCRDNPKGLYVLAISGHVVAVENGSYYDVYDSGEESPIYAWRKAQDEQTSSVEQDSARGVY